MLLLPGPLVSMITQGQSFLVLTTCRNLDRAAKVHINANTSCHNGHCVQGLSQIMTFKIKQMNLI